MAQKKATIFILNVADSMSKGFSTALSVMTDTIEDKVQSGRKTDMVSVLLAGTPETHNILADQTPDQYQRITSMCPIVQPNVDLLKRIQNISTSGKDVDPADVFDSVIIAIQMIREHCRNLKYEKRIILITDNQNKIDWLDLDDVAEMLRDSNTQLTVIGTDVNHTLEPDCPEDVATNYKNWQLLIDKSEVGGELLSLETAYEFTQMDSAKEVRPTPSYRGYLYIGNPHESKHVIGISVYMYLRTKHVSLPSGHKYSAHSKGPTHKVEADVAYKYDKNPSAAISVLDDDVDGMLIEDKSRLEKAFRFGKTAILISSDEIVSNKFTSKKELTVIGFVDKKDLKRHYLYSNAYILTAGNYNTIESTLALSAFAKALYDEQSCAIVRYVQKDDGQPRIGILEAEDRQGEEDVEYLLQYFDLPFAEDIRDYKFKSITDPRTTDPKGIELMDSLIDSMDLDSTIEGKDYLTPEYTFNPILWRFNKAIRTRALNPDAPVPDIKKSSKCQFEIYPGFKEKANEYSDLLASHLNVRKVIEKDKGKRKYRDMDETADPDTTVDISGILENAAKSSQDGPTYAPLATAATSFNKSSARDMDSYKISMVTPVEDFLALLNTPSDVDMVEVAIGLIKPVIMEHLRRTVNDQSFSTIIGCLREFRKVAAKEDAAANYNSFMREVKQKRNLSNKSVIRNDFWELLKKEKLGLITNKECNDTDNTNTTEQVAEKFWDTDENEDQGDIERTDTTSANAANANEAAFNVDDLDDML